MIGMKVMETYPVLLFQRNKDQTFVLSFISIRSQTFSFRLRVCGVNRYFLYKQHIGPRYEVAKKVRNASFLRIYPFVRIDLYLY